MYVHCGSKLVDSGFESNFEKRVEHRVQEIWRTLQETNINLSLCDQLLDDFSQHCYNNSTVDCSTQTSFLQTTHLHGELSKKPESKYVHSNLVSNELNEDFKTTCVALNDNKKDNLNSENKKESVVALCTNIIHSIQEEIQDMCHALEISSGHQLKENLSLSISRLETCCHDLFFVFRVAVLFLLVACAAAAPTETKSHQKRGLLGLGIGGLGYGGLGYSGLGYGGLGYGGLGYGGLGYGGLGYGGLGHSSIDFQTVAAAPLLSVAAPVISVAAPVISAPISYGGLGYSGLSHGW